jgi:hypothetical protein
MSQSQTNEIDHSDDKENVSLDVNAAAEQKGLPTRKAIGEKRSSKLSIRYRQRRKRGMGLKKSQQLQPDLADRAIARCSKLRWASPVESSDENHDPNTIKQVVNSGRQFSKRESHMDDSVIQDQKRVRSSSKETANQDSYNFNFRMAENNRSGRIITEKSTFTKGDTIQSAHKKYDGLAFTIGERVGNSVKCHVWMKAEKTYLGDMLTVLGYEWVLLKKHGLLPSHGIIDLKYLWSGVKKIV